MPKTIKELQEIWEANKDGFKIQELGKLQDFIKDIIESNELFALSYSDLCKNYNVIFIDGEDVVIPVEVEKYGNIKAGEAQILQYQTDWRKKYGILTDGAEWRLYFDRWYETFHLQDILDKQSGFWKKWKLYTAPETYYDIAFNFKVQGELFESERLNPCTPENRPFFFNDITTLLTAFKAKIAALVPLFAKEDRQAVETTYSYVIQFILYKVLIDNNYQKLKNDYEAFRGWVQKAVRTKTYDEIIRGIKTIAEYIYKNVYEPFRQKQEDVNKRLIEQLKKSPTLEDIAPWLDIIMFIDRYDFSDIRNELFGFVYENYLKELYHEGNKGQYFTDPAVVNFMLEELGYTKEAVDKSGGKSISIIDPSCGAGTFLYSAALAIKEAFDNGTEANSKMIEELVNNNIFGLDMEEFPLFLAEMNILMQLLPVVVAMNYANPINEKLKLFITRDSIAEFLDTPIECDLRIKQKFDYVIGNPPYIGYNKCTHLPFAKKIKDKNDPFSMRNVYGVNLNTVPCRIKPYPPKPNLYAFFIALGLGLLKDKGKICYIIPQTILTAGDLDVLRYHLAKYTTIEKIITFEGNLFIGRGIKQNKPVPTSSLIFIAKKLKPQSNHFVKIVNYKTYSDKQSESFDTYFHSHNKEAKKIFQTDLLDNLDSWTFIKHDAFFLNFLTVYNNNSVYIEDWRNSVLKDYDEFCFDVGYILDKQYYSSNPNNKYPILDFKQSLGYSKMFFKEYYPKNENKIQLTRNSRYNTLGHKYNIVCRIKNFHKFMLIMEPVIFNMGQAAIIATDNKEEVFFLFALLNSLTSYKILENNNKIENEKEFLVSIKTIKQYIRIPKITAYNRHIKAEIIKQTEALLDLEKPVINDLVYFKPTTMRKFDFVRVEGKNLILSKGNRNYTSIIKTNKAVEIVKFAIEARYFPKAPFVLKDLIDIKELRFLPAIDFDEQAKVKGYIDDLVFALYFGIRIINPRLENAVSIHKMMAKNEYYPLVYNE